eukprot:7036723-Pyramimonas_sp.AAC.1
MDINIARKERWISLNAQHASGRNGKDTGTTTGTMPHNRCGQHTDCDPLLGRRPPARSGQRARRHRQRVLLKMNRACCGSLFGGAHEGVGGGRAA